MDVLKEEIITYMAKDLGTIAPINLRDMEKWTNFARIKGNININILLKTRLALPIPADTNHHTRMLYKKTRKILPILWSY